ncbi:MAG: hypothetical protein ACYDBB_06680 [Armatimonadota bacterium]
MSVEDKQLARLLTREMYRRRHLDLSDMRLDVTRGVGYIGGTIRPSTGEFIDPKTEAKALTDSVKRVPGLRDCVIDVKWDTGSKR